MPLSLRNGIRLSFILAGLYTLQACQPSMNANGVFYDALNDTIPPTVAMSVPADNAQYLYGEDIHFVGVVTDLQSKMKAGKLKSLRLIVNETDANNLTIVKELLQKNPGVDGKEGYTLNEKMMLSGGSGTTFCQAKATATDYSGRTFTDSVSFTIK